MVAASSARNETCTVVSVMPYMFTNSGAVGVAPVALASVPSPCLATQSASLRSSSASPPNTT
ncbi:hypothetical protein GCM10023318_06000 [Nocardia callitridis]|uniref:Uncharacterized protein n=1 Tax=Nocardia callitridis TaxID=648753 RepID=A0ABP9JTR7_9NOCA